MICRPIVCDQTLEELTRHGAPDFPVSMDEQIVSAVAGVPHWHHEIQISLCTRGEFIAKADNETYVIKENEAIFINSGIIHESLESAIPDSVYICVNFLPEIIYGNLDSIIRKNYVDPILFSSKMKVVKLSDEGWQSDICSLLLKLSEIESKQDFGYELEERNILCEIWRLLFLNTMGFMDNATSVSFQDEQRIKAIKKCIRKNYMYKLSLDDIAKAGYISKSECCRLFNRVERTSPIVYLRRYRIAQSIKFLTNTNMCISDVAQQCGFLSSSYFAESFKKEVGCTPLEYKKQNTSKAKPKDIAFK